MLKSEDAAIRAARLKAQESRPGRPGSFPNPQGRHWHLSPTIEEIDRVAALVAGYSFWIDSGHGRGWQNFPSYEVARLLTIRLWLPEQGVKWLEAGHTFSPTPTTKIRIAVRVGIYRVDDRRDQ